MGSRFRSGAGGDSCGHAETPRTVNVERGGCGEARRRPAAQIQAAPRRRNGIRGSWGDGQHLSQTPGATQHPLLLPRGAQEPSTTPRPPPPADLGRVRGPWVPRSIPGGVPAGAYPRGRLPGAGGARRSGGEEPAALHCAALRCPGSGGRAPCSAARLRLPLPRPARPPLPRQDAAPPLAASCGSSRLPCALWAGKVGRKRGTRKRKSD